MEYCTSVKRSSLDAAEILCSRSHPTSQVLDGPHSVRFACAWQERRIGRTPHPGRQWGTSGGDAFVTCGGTAVGAIEAHVNGAGDRRAAGVARRSPGDNLGVLRYEQICLSRGGGEEGNFGHRAAMQPPE
eukprot:scaffold133104_cov63-Phaeocystis_antarctica.AAC.3